MKSLKIIVVVMFTTVLLAGAVQATVTGYVNNPTGNSVDWNNAVVGLGGTVDTTVNFDSHPTGALQSTFYSGIGVTLTAGGDVNTVMFGAGPGDGNTGSTPKSTGEGLHPASNYLYDGGSPSTLTIDFAAPVLGAGLFVIDYFNPNITNTLTLAAYTGSGGTGTLLGSFSSVAYNFQNNYMYFMGLVSSAADIRSIVFTDVNNYTGDTTGIDNIRFATGGVAPIAPTAWLLGSGLLGLAGWRRFKK